VIVQLAVGPAMGTAVYPAAFLRRAMEMDSRRVVAAVSFAVRFLPETGLFAVVLFGLCRCPICLATAGFAPAAHLFDPFDLSAAVVAAAAVVVDLFDPSDLSVADLSVVAAGPGSVGLSVVAADLFCSVCSFAAGLGKGRVVVAVPICFLTHRSSF
jgi:hypothetical protein